MSGKYADGGGWHQPLTETLQSLYTFLQTHAPKILGALVLLIIGWIVAYALAFLTRKLIARIDQLFRRTCPMNGAKGFSIRDSYAKVAATLIFWATFSLFLVASAKVLKWPVLESWLIDFVQFLPHVIAGIFIISAGLLGGQFVYYATEKSLQPTLKQPAVWLAKGLQVALILIAVILGVEQLGIHVEFLSHILLMLLGISLLSFALSVSVGTYTIFSHMTGMLILRKECDMGEQLSIKQFQGALVKMLPTGFILQGKNDRYIIPGRLLHKHVISIQRTTED